MKNLTGLSVLFLYSQLGSCQVSVNDLNPAQPGEIIATIVGYSFPLENILSICGGSGHVDIDGQPFLSRAVPVPFQQGGLPIWVKYESDSVASSTLCRFVKFTSIRKR